MKHGIAFRKLSRTSSHRNLMLRNMVSSLLEHEQIKTTVPKAKEAARLADQMITLGKKGDTPARQRAEAFLLNPKKTLPLLFGQYADRYRERPGGYTRIHKFGYRQGDHAPHAILELVDNPRDIHFEMVARAVGRETVQHWLKTDGKGKGNEANEDSIADKSWIRPTTKQNYEQLMKFRDEQSRIDFETKAIDWANQLLADAKANGGLRRDDPSEEAQKVPGLTKPQVGRRQLAGERLPGMPEHASGLSIAAGSIGQGRAAEDVGFSANKTERIVEKRDKSKNPVDRNWRSVFWEGGWKESTAASSVSPSNP